MACPPWSARPSTQAERHRLVRDAGFLERGALGCEASALIEAERADLGVQDNLAITA